MLKNKKGQMFLILGILIVLFLISVRLAVQPPRSISVDETFNPINIREESKSVQKFSEVNRTNITGNIENFTGFIDDKLSDRGIGFTSIYLFGYLEPTSNGTQTNLTITVGNYLGSQISNVNVTLSNSSSTHNSTNLSTINNENTNTGNITFSMLAEQKTITLDYTLDGLNKTQDFTVDLKNGKTNLISFFDLTFTIIDKTTKERFAEVDYR